MPLTRPKAHQLSGQTAKSSVRVVTVSNVTLSGGAPATVDGVSLTLEDRILVTAQTDATENGIYRVTTVGSGSNGTWVRGRDANQSYEVLAGMTTMVSEGTTYADTFWKLTTDGEVTLGTTELTFEQHSTVEAKSIANLSDVTITSATSNDVLTYNGSAWVNNTAVNLSGNITGGNLTTTGALTVGTVLGNLVPTSNVTYTLGSSTNAWKDLYLGPGSLYINGQKVLEDTSGTINVTADQDQNLTIKTSGTGQTTVQSAAGVNLTTSGSADISLTTSTGQIELNGNVSLNSTNTINSADSNPITFGDDIALGTNNINSVGSITASTTATVTGNITGGNLITSALVSAGTVTATGNVTGGNLITSALVSAADVSASATITATGNITTSGSFIGDGSQLTGLPAGYTDANVTSLLSNLGSNNISTAGSITATGRVATDEVSAHGLSSTSSLTLRGGTSSDGIKLQFWDSSWTDALAIRESTHDILASYPFTATGNITGGNLLTGNVTIDDSTISATGNITTSGSFIGDGSQLTGVSSYTDSDAQTFLSSGNVGNISGGNLSLTGAATVGDSLTVTGNLTVNGTTTTINSTTLTVDDKQIIIAQGSANSSAADGAGISVDGADANITYTHSTSSWDFNKPVNVTGNVTVSGGLTVDTNTLYVDPTNNRVGIGTTTPAYQVEIENTSNNALLVLDRTDGASTFIEGGATDSVLGSVGANNVKIAYNSVPVVTIGAGGAITTSGNVTAGNLRADNLTTENAFAIVGSDNNLIQDTTLSVDPSSNYLGINQTSPEVTLHMTGEGAQTTQIRMEQYNDSADAPDVRTRRYRGTVASPSAVQSGDYLFRSNHEYYNGTSLLVGGAFAFDNTNNANRTQFSVAVDTDGTGADPAGNNGQFKIDGNDSGAITFNNAYKFPTADGSANQVLQTDGSGTLTFADQSAGGATYSTGNTAPVSPSVGDKWFDTDDEILFEYINDGTSNVWVDTTSASTGDSTTGDYAITGDFTASGNISQGPAGYQSNKYILYGTTTNADTTEIFIGGGSNSRVLVGNNTTMFYTVDIVARRTDATGESAGWTLKGVVDNVAGNVQNVGNVYEVAVASDDGNWAVDVVADNTDDAVNVVVTGAAGKTVKWMATVETQEITE